MTTRIHMIKRTLTFASLIPLAAQGSAQRAVARAGGQSRASATAHHRGATQSANRTNANRTVNHNVNVNRNVNVSANGRGYGYGAHPVARGAVAGVTAAAIMGHHYSTLPSGCSTVTHTGIVYHHCGSTWYRTDGSQYVVVAQP